MRCHSPRDSVWYSPTHMGVCMVYKSLLALTLQQLNQQAHPHVKHPYPQEPMAEVVVLDLQAFAQSIVHSVQLNIECKIQQLGRPKMDGCFVGFKEIQLIDNTCDWKPSVKVTHKLLELGLKC